MRSPGPARRSRPAPRSTWSWPGSSCPAALSRVCPSGGSGKPSRTPSMQVRTAFPCVTSFRRKATVSPMKMSNDLEKKFQEQITLEFAASITYRQLAIEADEQDLSGIAAWLRHQADEEIVHANKFIQHVSDRGNRATIGAIAAPEVTPGLS